MGWYKSIGFNKPDLRIKGKCLFCGHTKEIKRTDFIIEFSEFERQKGNICRDCYVANSARAYIS
jgi:hypothetical protein